ncbi:MAG: hypothetical protein N2Z82_09925 [Thermomicrobium sp.]|nr:hypothetical protein [Thermomicrobium sp.]
MTLLTGCAPALLTLWLARELAVAPMAGRDPRGLFWACLAHPAVRRLVLTGVALASGGGLVLPFVNLFFLETFAVGSREIAFVRVGATLATVAGALAAPLLAARAGLLHGVVLGRSASAPWLLLTDLAPTWWSAGGAYAVRTFCVYCSDPLHTDFSMRVVPPGLRATASSLTFLSWNVSLAVTGWIGGELAARVGYPALFSLGTVLTLAAAACFWFAFRAAQLQGSSRTG